MTITSSQTGTKYSVTEKKLGGTEVFNLYECILPDGIPSILKIATTVANNGALDREAFVLETMKEEAQKLEEEYSKESDGKNYPLNNHFFFPNLVETFISTEQDNRRVSILSFPNVAKKLSDLVPLSSLVNDYQCVDPRTSGWILGKLLKFLVFIHQQNITNSVITGDNILINKEGHFVCFFDWTQVILSPVEISCDIASKDIASVTREVLTILGAKNGTLPADDQLIDNRYENLLKRFVSGEETDAYAAHTKFYELIRELWPRAYHPFTIKSIH